jgi:hypothetical protein
LNAPRIDPTNQQWQEMTSNSNATIETYSGSSGATRKTTRQILEAVVKEVEPLSLEGQALAYLIGRLDEFDIAHAEPESTQNKKRGNNAET